VPQALTGPVSALALMRRVKDQFDPEWQAALIGSKDVPTAMNTAASLFAEILGDKGELKYPAS
jgi:hypothetical protein